MRGQNAKPIPSELYNASTNGFVTSAEQVKDYKIGMSQEDINQFFLHKRTKHVTVTATPETTSVEQLLPPIGDEDTIYRVGSWDGDANEYNSNKHSEYGWNSSGDNPSYILLSVEDYGIDDEPTPGSTNTVTSGGVAAVEGYYDENPEYLRVYLDKEGHILWAIETDGNILYGVGIPRQIKEYVSSSIKPFKELLYFEKNPEYVDVKLDGENKILEAIYKDGTKLLPAGYNINGVTVNNVNNPEFLAVWLDDSKHILFALDKDGNVIFAAGVPKQIIKCVKEIIKPFEELFHFEDNSEFIETTLDAEGKISEATRTNGIKVLPAGAEFGGNVITSESNPEYIEVFVDGNNRIINSVDKELEDIKYGGINISEMKRDADCDVLQCGFDADRDDIYTIENNESTITMEVDDDLNVYEVKDSSHTAEIVMEDSGEVYLEQTIKEI